MDETTRAFYARLPKKRMGAGCLLFDEQDRLLLVKPAYKPTWEIPGGIIEQDESPKTACQREVVEELGIELPIGRLLVIDYSHPNPEKTESLMFIFAGGRLSPDEIQAIHLPAGELLQFRFFAHGELPVEMSASLRRRVLAAWEQLSQPGARYLEDQTPA
jgi:8-oxo-dGTP diphosphatase